MGVCYIDSHFSDVKWWNRAIQRSSWFKCNRKRPCEIVRWYHSNRICIYSVCDAITYSLLVLILSTSIEFLIFGSFVPYSVFVTSFRSGSRGRVQGMRPPHPPSEMACGFLIQLYSEKKNYVVYWCWSRARDECTPSQKIQWGLQILFLLNQVDCHHQLKLKLGMWKE